jgi:hypothetical protein
MPFLMQIIRITISLALFALWLAAKLWLLKPLVKMGRARASAGVPPCRNAEEAWSI